MNKNQDECRPVPSKYKCSFRSLIKGMFGEYEVKEVQVPVARFIYGHSATFSYLKLRILVDHTFSQYVIVHENILQPLVI